MLKELFGPRKEDICPNCGTRCFATDSLCPKCGKNLDELFEQLPLDSPITRPIITLRPEHKLLLAWVAATAVGTALGDGFLRPVAYFLVPNSLLDINFDLFGFMPWAAAVGIVTGLAVGALQYLTIRNYIVHGCQWILATSLGMAGRYLPMDLAAGVRPVDEWTGLCLGGMVIGFCQWLVLRKYLHRAWIWIICSGVGWALAMLIGTDVISSILYPNPPGFLGLTDLEPLGALIIFGIVGILYGITTGLLLLWLFRKNGVRVGGAASSRLGERSASSTSE